MWKLATATVSRSILNKHCSITPPFRLFLTDSYNLKEVWNKRLNSPILKQINVSDMFYELDNQFQHFACASGLDIDIFVNAVNDASNFDEVEDMVHKLRLSPEAISILPSTHHALIRLYLEYNKTDELMRILDDRLNYGIFPDDYCSLLLMDNFIKNGDFKNAAKVSTLSMLQEDFSNPLIKYLSIYSCHKYLENPVPWNQEADSPIQEEEDDEEVKVRVKYIRNPFFDDHFDLVEPNHLIGKTLNLIGSETDDPVGRTYKLIGLLLHDKFVDVNIYLRRLQTFKENPILFKDGLIMVKKILNEKANSEGAKNDKIQLLVNEIKELLDKFTESQLASKGNLLSFIETRIKELVQKHEQGEINKQLQLYQDWENNRENLLKQQIASIKREKEIAEIQHQKELLKAKEEEIFFFENEDKLDLIIEEKDKKKEEQQERERLKAESKLPKKKIRVTIKPPEPTLESYFDENIPMKLVKTKL